MKNKSKIMKYLIMFFVFLVLSLIVLIFFLFGKIKSLEKDKTEKKVIHNTVITKSYSVKDIEKLIFDFKNSNVNYISYNEDKILIKQSGKTDTFFINKNKNQYELSLSESGTNIFAKVKYKVYIPSSYINKIDIKNGFGNISIDSLKNDLSIDNNAGKVSIGNINNIYIKNVSGIVNINKTNNIDVISSTGDIIIDSIGNMCNIETITGDITINKFKINMDSKIESTSGNIILKVDKESSCKFKYSKNENYSITKKKCIDGLNILTIKNVTGNVIIK